MKGTSCNKHPVLFSGGSNVSNRVSACWCFWCPLHPLSLCIHHVRVMVWPDRSISYNRSRLASRTFEFYHRRLTLKPLLLRSVARLVDFRRLERWWMWVFLIYCFPTPCPYCATISCCRELSNCGITDDDMDEIRDCFDSVDRSSISRV